MNSYEIRRKNAIKLINKLKEKRKKWKIRKNKTLL